MIRKLYLENKNGVTYYFNYQSGTLISDIDGLGFEHELSYLRYQNMYERVEQTIPISEIKATLTFLKGYSGYLKFLDYLKSVDNGLFLHYDAGEEKYAYIDIKSVSKSELVFGVLQCQIVFNKLSPWLKEKVVSIEANGDSTGKVHPYKYPYSYSKSFEGKINITNIGVFKAPLKFEIYGSVKNPEIYIYKDNQVVSTLRLFVDSLNVIITVSSVPTNQFIEITENGIKRNIYDLQDFTCDNFIYLDPGEYIIEFKPGVSTITNCRVTILEGYLGN